MFQVNGGASGVSQTHLEQENEELRQENMRLEVDSFSHFVPGPIFFYSKN